MSWLDAFILGVVEGLTEFLPVSSTGHLILTNALLGLDGVAADAYTIVIQLGAILAVLALYRERARQMIEGILGRNPAGLQLFLKLFVAFLPAVFLGLLLDEAIEKYLFHAAPVAGALIMGGVVMIAVEQGVVRRREAEKGEGALKIVDQMSYKDALVIGFAQCLAMWPGTSRSMCTIVGAQLMGFRSKDAAEISFLLALPTLGGATVYKLVKEREAFLAMEGGIPLILFGNVIAFVVAFLAVKWFVGVVTRYGMTPFGIYRIIIGGIFLALWYFGWLVVGGAVQP